MRVKFKTDNDVFFSQDCHYCRGIPANIWFDVEEQETFWILTALGYGKLHPRGQYGNGALFIHKKAR